MVQSLKALVINVESFFKVASNTRKTAGQRQKLRWRVTFSSHHRTTDTDKTRQDCLILSCRWCEQNWRQVKTVGDRKFWNVLSSFKMKWGLIKTLLCCRQFFYIIDKEKDSFVLYCQWCEVGIRLLAIGHILKRTCLVRCPYICSIFTRDST